MTTVPARHISRNSHFPALHRVAKTVKKHPPSSLPKRYAFCFLPHLFGQQAAEGVAKPALSLLLGKHKRQRSLGMRYLGNLRAGDSFPIGRRSGRLSPKLHRHQKRTPPKKEGLQKKQLESPTGEHIDSLSPRALVERRGNRNIWDFLFSCFRVACPSGDKLVLY